MQKQAPSVIKIAVAIGFTLSCFMLLYMWFVFYMPNYLGDAENYIPANPGVTPAHIVPEWYFLPFYAILRAIPNKLAGVIAIGASVGSPDPPGEGC